MRKILIILFILCTPVLLGKKWYVSPTGDDTYDGEDSVYVSGMDGPWKTWGKAFNHVGVAAGDTVYFRGGVYYKAWSEGSFYHTDNRSYRIDNGGESGAYVNYWNYPGEVPILDCSNITPNTTNNYAIRGGASYTYFKGLTIRNVLSVDGGVGGASVECVGWKITGDSVTIENMTIYNIHGIGFQAVGTGYEEFINCDAYDCNDIYAVSPQLPGNRGSGFSALNQTSTAAHYKFVNCRAWDCGDQGFSGLSDGDITWDGCWSFTNGKLQGGGHGYKIGWATETGSARNMNNCWAAYNRHYGITTNENISKVYVSAMSIYNNTCYVNGYFGVSVFNTGASDTLELGRVFKNNIAYDNSIGNFYLAANATYTHSNNSWDISGLTINSTDFLSLDSTGITGSRQADGSLPDLDFLKLANNSQAIDQGVNVGMAYMGDAPDIGAYEWDNYATPPALPSIATVVPYNVASDSCTTGGHMIDAGGLSITDKGVCWSTSENPTTADDYTSGGTGVDDFIINITGLDPITTYHVRAYAVNSEGTAYGNDQSFTTTRRGKIKSTDGKYIKQSDGKYIIIR